MTNKPHPWGRFLNARRDAMAWMFDEMGYDYKTIANKMCMDEMQVYLILASTHFPIPEGSIKEKGKDE